MKKIFGWILIAIAITACAKDTTQKKTVNVPKPMANCSDLKT